MPIILQYIAKLEGKYATDAWKRPGLESMTIKNIMATLGFSALAIVENSLDWQAAHASARMLRMK